MKDTTVISFFGAPGAGKSTGAAYMYSRLSMAGLDCEYVTEFAKECFWNEDSPMFSVRENQMCIFAGQLRKMTAVYGKVDVLVTDSPLLMSLVYADCDVLGDCYRSTVARLASRFQKGVSFLVKRTCRFNGNGRNEDEAGSAAVDARIRSLLREFGVEFYEIGGNEDGYDSSVSLVMRHLGVDVSKR